MEQVSIYSRLVIYVAFVTCILIVKVNAQTTFEYLSEIKHGDSLVTAINLEQKKISADKSYQLLPELVVYLESLDTLEVNDRWQQRKTLARLANLFAKTGNTHQSKALYSQASEVLSRDELANDIWVFYVENPLAIIYTQLGDYEKAAELYDFSIGVLNNIGEKEKAIRTLNNLAIVHHSQGKFKESKYTYHRSIKQSNEVKFDDGFIKASIGIVKPLIALGEYNEALRVIRYIDSNELRDPSLAYMHFHNKASYYEETHDYSKALSHIESSDSLLSILFPTDTKRELAKHHYKKAKLYTKLVDIPNAKVEILNGIKALVHDTDRILLEDYLLYPENSFAEIYELYGDIMISEFQTNHQDSDLSIGIEAYLKAAYIYYMLREDYLLTDSKLLSADIATDVRNKGFDAMALLPDKAMAAQLAKQFLATTKNTILDDDILNLGKISTLSEQQQKKLKTIRKNLRNKIRTQASYKEKLVLVDSVESILDKAKEIKSDSYHGKYVEYIVTKSSIFALHNFKGQPRLERVANSLTTEQLISSYQSQVLDPENIEILNKTLDTLFNTILKPLSPLPKTFSIITDDMLALLSFDLLRSNDKYLVQDHVIDYRLSTKTLNPAKRGKGIAIVSPHYGAVNDILSLDRSAIYPLQYATYESEVIASIYETKISDISGSNENLTSMIEKSKVLHFSGHARPDHGGRLILEGAEGKATKSISGQEISLMNSSLQLAVLSACETGLGTQAKGESMLSITRAFMQGGTSNVINSLWAVNDQTTASIMQTFHSNLASGNSFSSSLREAKLEYLQTHEGAEIHPYYWGGFIHTTLEPEPTKTRGDWRWILLGLSIMLFSYFYFTSKPTS